MKRTKLLKTLIVSIAFILIPVSASAEIVCGQIIGMSYAQKGSPPYSPTRIRVTMNNPADAFNVRGSDSSDYGIVTMLATAYSGDEVIKVEIEDCYETSCLVRAEFMHTTDMGICVSNCGNGVVNSGEHCDDGNLNNYDGCNNGCLLKPKLPF